MLVSRVGRSQRPVVPAFGVGASLGRLGPAASARAVVKDPEVRWRLEFGDRAAERGRDRNASGSEGLERFLHLIVGRITLARSPRPRARSRGVARKETTMRAITVDEYGAAPALTEVPDPHPGSGQVLIKIEAA